MFVLVCVTLANRLGLYSKGCHCLSGEEVDHLDLQELSNIVPRVKTHTFLYFYCSEVFYSF